MTRYVLAIDQSTSGTKALLFDTQGRVVDQIARPHKQHYPQPAWVEHDADEIYQNTIGTLRDLLRRPPVDVADILCLSITNQRETFVVYERGTGKPLYHAIVWQCRRGDSICREMIAAGHEPEVAQKTGLKIDTYFPASKITWLMHNRPDIAGRLRDGSALLGTIDAYLIYRLSGGRVHACDSTNASRTLLYDIGTLRWDESLCGIFGVPRCALPEVRESAARFGVTDLEGTLPAHIPICGVMGDSQAALLAEHCVEPGGAKVTFGSGSSVLLNTGSQRVRSHTGNVSTLGWVHDGQPTYALEGIINYTGATIAWLCDQAQLIDNPSETDALASSVPDSAGVYLVPAFVGLSAPYWDQSARGAILGLSPSATRAHIVRAALEAIAYRVKDVLGAMAEDARLSLNEVHADGGMVANRFLMQFVADMTGLTVQASTLPELSALGAVMSGLVGMGRYPTIPALDALEQQATAYHPAMPTSHVEALYAGWREAVARVLSQH